MNASPWLEDNQWVLDIAAKDRIIVGTVGDLEPGKPEFRKHLERFHRNPLFRGIRCGNLWERSLSGDLAKPDVVSDLKALADANLEMDSANPDPALVSALLRVNDKVPGLRLVLDHTPQLELPSDPQARQRVESELRELASRPGVYFKLSAVLRPVNGHVPLDLDFYRPRLDELWGDLARHRSCTAVTGPTATPRAPTWRDSTLFASILRSKSPAAQEKFFWKNSLHAYRWVKRASDQPQA